MILKQENIELSANEDDIYSFLISIATGEKTFEAIKQWLKENSVVLNK